MYFSYFVLFARFFYKAYLSPGGHKSRRMAASLVAQNTAKLSSPISTSDANVMSNKYVGEDAQAAYMRKAKAQ